MTTIRDYPETAHGQAFQGDVLIARLPVRYADHLDKSEPVPPVAGRLILQEGELTNHHHAIALAPRPASFVERLRSVLDYSPETGDFFWREWVGGSAHAGSVAGSPNSCGYTLIKIDGSKYQASRLAWIHFYGEEPEDFIDHINGNRRDNRIANLRVVSRRQNKANSAAGSNSVSGVKGVFWNAKRKKWQARICLENGKRQHLGYYHDISEAEQAYKSAEMSYRGEYSAAFSRSPAAEDLMAAALARRISLTPATASLHRDRALSDRLVRDGILTRSDLVVGFLTVEGGPMTVTHEEHDGIRLPPGLYLIGRQIESAGAEERMVQD